MSVWDKLSELKDSLEGSGGDRVDSGVVGESKGEKEAWTSKIKDILDGGEERKKREEEEERLRIAKEKEEAKRNVEAERGLAGKIHDALDGGKHRQVLEEAEFQRIDHEAQLQRKTHEGLSEKIKNALDGADELERKVMEVNHHQREKVSTKEGEHDQEQDASGHFSDKVKGLWHNAPSEEKHEQQEHHQIWKSSNNAETAGSESQERKDEGWREKLRALAGTPNKEEKKQVERGWLKEKLNEMAGGGAKSELDEDKLDKTVDFVQQYILHEGDQSNESALEQMKDEQISDAIRMAFQQVSGHELPVHDK